MSEPWQYAEYIGRPVTDVPGSEDFVPAPGQPLRTVLGPPVPTCATHKVFALSDCSWCGPTAGQTTG